MANCEVLLKHKSKKTLPSGSIEEASDAIKMTTFKPNSMNGNNAHNRKLTFDSSGSPLQMSRTGIDPDPRQQCSRSLMPHYDRNADSLPLGLDECYWKHSSSSNSSQQIGRLNCSFDQLKSGDTVEESTDAGHCSSERQDESYATHEAEGQSNRGTGSSSDGRRDSTPDPACRSNGPALNSGLVHNTLRKTRSDMKVVHRYLAQIKCETREIHHIPCQELDRYIQDFIVTAKKKDGHEYEPESLKAFVHSLERHLKYNGYPHSVLKGSAFVGTRAVLNRRLSELRALSRAGSTVNCLDQQKNNDSRSTDGSSSVNRCKSSNYLNRRAVGLKRFSAADAVPSGILGPSSPQAILNSLWLMNRTQFNIGGTQRHRNLVWGQFQVVSDDHGGKVLKFTPLFESTEVLYCRGFGVSKVPTRGESSTARSSHSSQVGLKHQPLPFDCVELFETYANLRPAEARGVSEPFYLAPDANWERGSSWFKTNAAGSQLIARIPRFLGLKPARDMSGTCVSTNFRPQHSDDAIASEAHTMLHHSQQLPPLPFEPNVPLGQTAEGSHLERSIVNHLAQFTPAMMNLLPLIFPTSTLQSVLQPCSPILPSMTNNLCPPQAMHLAPWSNTGGKQIDIPTIKQALPDHPEESHFHQHLINQDRHNVPPSHSCASECSDDDPEDLTVVDESLGHFAAPLLTENSKLTTSSANSKVNLDVGKPKASRMAPCASES